MTTRKRSGKKGQTSGVSKASKAAAKKAATKKGDAAGKTGAGKKAAAKAAPGKAVSKKGGSKGTRSRRAAARGGSARESASASRATTGPRFPGFDTGSYPGDGVMRAWFGNPYVFAGFYLDAPCHRDTTSGGSFRPWMGHLQTLLQIGWGLIIIYVGRQGRGCGSNSLTRARGLADAQDAIAKTRGEGVRDGATIFLDVELVDDVPANLLRYVRGWLAGVLADRRYQTGIYCHFRNANVLNTAARQEYAEQGRPGEGPAFWVVRAPGGSAFNVATSSPRDLNNFANTPISFASVWQGRIDIKSETHGGVRFGPVDQDVADTDNPSNV